MLPKLLKASGKIQQPLLFLAILLLVLAAISRVFGAAVALAPTRLCDFANSWESAWASGLGFNGLVGGPTYFRHLDGGRSFDVGSADEDGAGVWSLAGGGNTHQIVGMAASGVGFVALIHEFCQANGSRILISHDGLNWTQNTNHGILGQPFAITFNGKFFVATGSVFSSRTGGGTWSAESLPVPVGYSGPTVKGIC
jgi:hypothetical protein